MPGMPPRNIASASLSPPWATRSSLPGARLTAYQPSFSANRTLPSPVTSDCSCLSMAATSAVGAVWISTNDGWASDRLARFTGMAGLRSAPPPRRGGGSGYQGRWWRDVEGREGADVGAPADVAVDLELAVADARRRRGDDLHDGRGRGVGRVAPPAARAGEPAQRRQARADHGAADQARSIDSDPVGGAAAAEGLVDGGEVVRDRRSDLTGAGIEIDGEVDRRSRRLADARGMAERGLRVGEALRGVEPANPVAGPFVHRDDCQARTNQGTGLGGGQRTGAAGPVV